jgi:hypothetical protein
MNLIHRPFFLCGVLRCAREKSRNSKQIFAPKERKERKENRLRCFFFALFCVLLRPVHSWLRLCRAVLNVSLSPAQSKAKEGGCNGM